MSITIEKELGNLILSEYQSTYPEIINNNPILPNINERFDNVVAKSLGDMFYDDTSIDLSASIQGTVASSVTGVTASFTSIPDENDSNVASAIQNAKTNLGMQSGFGDDFLGIFVNAFRDFLSKINELDYDTNNPPTVIGSNTNASKSLDKGNMIVNVKNYLLSLGFTKYNDRGEPINVLPDFTDKLIDSILDIYDAIVSNSTVTVAVIGSGSQVNTTETVSGPAVYP